MICNPKTKASACLSRLISSACKSGIALSLLTLALVVAPQHVDAQPLKIAVVDFQKAITMSREGEKAQDKLKKDVEKLKGDLKGKKDDFDRKKEKYEEQKESLNERARMEKQEELISMERDLKRSLKDAEETFSRKNNALVSDIVTKLKEEGYDLVLEKSGQAVVYFAESIDITETIVERFNKSAKK